MENTESSMAAPVTVSDESGVAAPEGGMPTAKAPGPSPPRVENPEIENLSGNTVHGVLLGGEDLVTVPLDTLQRLQMSRVECSESFVRNLSYEVAKSEAERWHKAANTVVEGLYKLQDDLDFLQKAHSLDPSQTLEEMVLPADRGVHAGKATTELQILIQASNIRYTNLRAGAAFHEICTSRFSQSAAPATKSAHRGCCACHEICKRATCPKVTCHEIRALRRTPPCLKCCTCHENCTCSNRVIVKPWQIRFAWHCATATRWQ